MGSIFVIKLILLSDYQIKVSAIIYDVFFHFEVLAIKYGMLFHCDF